MNSVALHSIAAAAIFLGAIGQSAAASAADQKIAVEVRAVLAQQEAAWNRGDIDGFMNGYARSESTTFISGHDVTHGWTTVRDRYRKKYGNREKMGTLTFSDLQVAPHNADTAIATGKWELRRKTDTPHGAFKLLLKRTADGWRIVRDETTSA